MDVLLNSDSGVRHATTKEMLMKLHTLHVNSDRAANADTCNVLASATLNLNAGLSRKRTSAAKKTDAGANGYNDTSIK